MALKTYQGGCHCGKVKYEAKLDLAKGTGKCNCSICQKGRVWGMSIKPDAFKLLQGESELSDYQFNTKSMHHVFCKHCGIRSFGHGDIEAIGGKFVIINVACLDNVAPEELGDAPVHYSDGLHDNWMKPPAYTKHL
jgi:hypothetical protein